MAGEYTILITDKFCTVQGDVIDSWDNIDVTLRFNEPSSGLFTTPGYQWIRDQLVPGNRVVVMRDGKNLITGPIENYLHERSDDGENAGDGKLTVHFADDLSKLAGRLAYPNPALAPADQTTDNWLFSGNAEVGLRTLADLNGGPGARAERRVSKLVLGSLASVGSNITAKAERMEPLLDVARRMAIDGGDLGFRTLQVGSNIQFQVYAPPDVSGNVRFSFDLGNVKYMGYELVAPSATVMMVGGQGEGADRLVIERSAPGINNWGRIEKLLSRPGTTPTAELNADADRALLDEAESVRVPSNVATTPDQVFGVHYDLGSRVALSPWPGKQVTDVVRSVHLQVWPTAGEIFTPTIGSQAASTDQATIRALQQIFQRLGHLERITKASTPI